MRIPPRFSFFSPAVQREIIRRSTPKNAISAQCASTTRTLSNSTTLPKQYSFHIGTSWTGKVDRDGNKQFKIPFSADSTIGSWRDKMLSRPKAPKAVDAGEDFFFVQEVRGAGM
jgi:protein phosphatase PTC7